MAENNNLGIKIIAKLDPSKSINQINDDLKTLANSPKLHNLDINVNAKGISNDVNKELKKVKGKDISVSVDTKQIKEEFKEVGRAIDGYEKEFKSSTTSVTKNIDQQSGQIKSLIVTMKDAQNVVRKMRLSPIEDPATGATTYKMSNDDMQVISKANEEREKALRYEQKTRKAVQETLQEEKEKSEELEYQIQKAKELAKYKKQDLERRYGSVLTSDQNKQLEDYVKNMNAVTTATKKPKREIDRLNTGLRGLESQVKATGSKVNGFGANLKEAISRIPVWMIGMTANIKHRQ